MKAEDLYLTIINNLYDGVYFVDMSGKITFWNTAAECITGYKKEEIIGKSCGDNFLNHVDRSGNLLCAFGCPLRGAITDGRQRSDEVFLKHKDGYRISVLINIIPIIDGGKVTGAVEIFSPSSTIQYENDFIEKLTDMAMNDPLTGIANRRKIENHLEYKFHELQKNHNMFCVVFFDIDNFRDFNNRYGHEVGDIVLKGAVKSVCRSIRAFDLVGRWGGEEFVGIFEVNREYEAVLIAEKIRSLIEASHIYHNGEVFSITISVGVTLARDDDSISTIINRADALMYQSKRKGKNCVTSDT